MINRNRKLIFERLNPFIKRKVKVYKGNTLINHSIDINNIYVLISGTIKLIHFPNDNKEILLGYYETPMFFMKEKTIFSLTTAFGCEAITDCVFGVVDFNLLKKNNFEILSLILKYYELLFQKFYLQISDIAFNNKLLALMSVLIRLSNTYGINVSDGVYIDKYVSNLDLAEFLGVAPESISRLLKKLKEKKLVKIKNKKIILTNKNFMEKKLNCNNCNKELCKI